MTAQSLPVICAAIFMSLNDSCSCNLHGQFCTTVNGTTACECSHFTAGVSCERCLPLYNNRTWQPGSYLPYPTGSANECQSKSRDVANVSVDHAKVHGGPIVVCLLLMLKWSWAALSFCFVVLALFELINIQILMNIVSVVTMGDSQVLGSFCRSHYASYRILQDASVTITPSAVRTTLTSVTACVTIASTTRAVSSASTALTDCIVTTRCHSPVQTSAQVGKRRDIV